MKKLFARFNFQGTLTLQKSVYVTPGEHMSAGRKWRTECDTAVTGGNGCRSHIVADVVQATKKGAGYTYKMVRKEVFNNIVLFEASA